MSTKFLRKTTRRLIREFDEFQNSYPSLIRTSDPIDNGVKYNIKFDDVNTTLYEQALVSFPAMTVAGVTSLPSSTIAASVDLQKRAQEQIPSLPGAIEGLVPFNESLFNLPATLENTSSIALAPGFSIPARSKIGIPIDITSQTEKTLFRLGLADTNADPRGLFYGSGSTGFYYYNFDLKRWEDIGLVNNSYVGYMGNVTPADETTFSGQNYFMAQFNGTPNAIGTSVLTSFGATTVGNYYGYDKIGKPTEFFDAPNAPRYHATSSQGLPMSNYIEQPFVLERVDVKIPIVARRKHGRKLGGATDPFEASLRDVDNLVFFLYRQMSGKDDSSKTSLRYLIAHESVSFYNSAINGSANYLSHNPVFSHDYRLTISSSQEAVFTGSVSFSMYPKVTSPNFGGVSAYTVYDTAHSKFRNASVLNYWSGPMLSSLSSSVNPVNGALGPSGINTFWRTRNTTENGLVFDTSLNPDQRFLTNYATGSLTPTYSGGIYVSLPQEQLNSKEWSYHDVPYILFPEDRLIIGLESDINSRMTADGNYVDGYDTSPLSQTSSFFKVLTNQAQITLYGSLIQNSVAKRTNSINQNLISPAVHEVITNTQDDTDQFDISEKSLYSGSYLDNYITGSIFNGTRGVAQSLINWNIKASGSFERFVTIPDDEKTYFQTGPSSIKLSYPFPQVFSVAYSSPINPRNIFRSNKHGNLRDMLEQSRDYRIFNQKIYKKNGGFEDYGPVYAKFVLSSSEIPTSASFTNCNNLSPFMTGTFPFIEGVNTSRSGINLPVSNNNPFVPITNIFKT